MNKGIVNTKRGKHHYTASGYEIKKHNTYIKSPISKSKGRMEDAHNFDTTRRIRPELSPSSRH